MSCQPAAGTVCASNRPNSTDVAADALLCKTPAQPDLVFNASGRDETSALDAMVALFLDPAAENLTSPGWHHCVLAEADEPPPRIDGWLRVRDRPLNSTHAVRCTFAADDALAAAVSVQVSLNDQDYSPERSRHGRFHYVADIEPALAVVSKAIWYSVETMASE